MLGQEFTELLAYTDFKSCQRTFPFVRSALCCAQMTAPKNCVKDGISKLLCNSDFDKLKSKGMQEAMLEAETFLKDAWELGNSHGLETDSMALPFGRTGTFLDKQAGQRKRTSGLPGNGRRQ